MKEASRYIEATETRDYILPAIMLGPAKYHERAVHIGIDRGNGKVACLCGQHHKQETDVWESPSVVVNPDITCGGCLRSMRALIRKSSAKPYMVIMQKIGQKIKDAQFHIKKTDSTSANYGPYAVVPETRIEGISRELPDGKSIPACYTRKFVPGSFYGVSTPSKDDVFHILPSTKIVGGAIAPLCGADAPNDHMWVEVLYNQDYMVPHITCPACAERYIKSSMIYHPRRDKTFVARSNMVNAMAEHLNRVWNRYKEVFRFVVNAPDEDVPDKWRQIVNDYDAAYKNLQLMHQSCEGVI